MARFGLRDDVEVLLEGIAADLDNLEINVCWTDRYRRLGDSLNGIASSVRYFGVTAASCGSIAQWLQDFDFVRRQLA